MIQACGAQVRVAGMGGLAGLDFGAVLAMGAAMGADTAVLAEILPEVEAALLKAAREGRE